MPKISLEGSRDLDRSENVDFSEISQDEANLDHAKNDDLKLDKATELTKTPEEMTNPINGDSPRRELE
ncbi:MAG: hypothetical protein ACKPCM_15985, partial [Pseudanabaena sp.]